MNYLLEDKGSSLDLSYLPTEAIKETYEVVNFKVILRPVRIRS